MKMSTIAQKALEDSIAHWKQVVANPFDERIGSTACALCVTFNQCDGCPVAAYTREVYCLGTPYCTFVAARHATKRQAAYKPNEEAMSKLRRLANDELQFLISLREENVHD